MNIFRCKICEFVGENSFTKYCENERDSLKLFTKISLNFVNFWGNHQSTTNKNPNANVELGDQLIALLTKLVTFKNENGGK